MSNERLNLIRRSEGATVIYQTCDSYLSRRQLLLADATRHPLQLRRTVQGSSLSARVRCNLQHHAAVTSATSQADSQADLWVQRAALQGMIDACRKNDVSDFIQFLGFAQQPRKTMRQLPERMNHQKTGIPTWPIWAGIVVAALVGQFLKRR